MPTKKIDRPKKEIHYVVCPMCAMNRVVHKKGSRAILEHKSLDIKEPGRVVFGAINVQSDPFIDIRMAVGGTTGFKRVKTFSLPEVIKSGVYKDFEDQIKEQCLQILNVLGHAVAESPISNIPLPAPQSIKKPVEKANINQAPKTDIAIRDWIHDYFTDILIKSPVSKNVFEERYSGMSLHLPSGDIFSTENLDLGMLYDVIMREVNKMPKKKAKSVDEMGDDEFNEYISKQTKRDIDY